MEGNDNVYCCNPFVLYFMWLKAHLGSAWLLLVWQSAPVIVVAAQYQDWMTLMSTPEDLCLNQRQWSLPWWHQTDQQAVWAAKFLTVHPVEQQLEFHCPEWTVRTQPKIKNRNNVSVLMEKQMACCDRKKCYVPRGFSLCAVPDNIYTPCRRDCFSKTKIFKKYFKLNYDLQRWGEGWAGKNPFHGEVHVWIFSGTTKFLFHLHIRIHCWLWFQILLSKWDLCCFGEGALKAGFH